MLNENGLAEKDMKMHVFHFNHENEFTSSSFIKIESGTGLPGNSTLVSILDMKDGFTQVFNEVNQSWEYVEDHRYTEIYNIHTQQKEEVNYIGPLKSEHTTIAPPSYYHEFINGEWIITDEKQAEIDAMQKQQRINELESEKEKVSTSMMKNGFLGNTEDAKADAMRLEEIEAEIKKLKE